MIFTLFFSLGLTLGAGVIFFWFYKNQKHWIEQASSLKVENKNLKNKLEEEKKSL